MQKTIKKAVTLALILAVILTAVVAFAVPWESPADAASIKQGATGTTVRTIQTKLKNWGYLNDAADGIFGAKTKEAVKLFQRKNGLTADGIVGNATAAKLGITLSGSGGGSTSNNTSSSSSTYLLARCIYAEARGEPYSGQVAVGAVILNRVKSSQFPNSISGVIYQPWAFTCVNDGQINLAPDDTAMRAAKDAMSGWDPSYGCLFYYNPRTATSSWIKQKKIAITIGRHVFCY